MDRLFAYVLEERRRCVRCGGLQVQFASESLLVLPLPAETHEGVTVTERYWEFCKRAQGETMLQCHGVCEGMTAHEVQRRLVTTPNLLF